MLTEIEPAAKNAPAGSENALALFKAAVVGATSAIEGVKKGSRLGVGLLEELDRQAIRDRF